jgi:RNA polymerase sigma factor (TIGR02999 family)
MHEVTQILNALDAGDPRAAEQLLQLVYAELRNLAAQKIALEKPGQTLQATALVHEAYLRLVDSASPQNWHSRGHFFAAAAEAMRRILVEAARRKNRIKHGGEFERVELDDIVSCHDTPDNQLLALDDALLHLQAADPAAATLVKLRYFSGLTMPDAAAAMGISLRTAERNWTFARTWLHRRVSAAGGTHTPSPSEKGRGGTHPPSPPGRGSG